MLEATQQTTSILLMLLSSILVIDLGPENNPKDLLGQVAVSLGTEASMLKPFCTASHRDDILDHFKGMQCAIENYSQPHERLCIVAVMPKVYPANILTTAFGRIRPAALGFDNRHRAFGMLALANPHVLFLLLERGGGSQESGLFADCHLGVCGQKCSRLIAVLDATQRGLDPLFDPTGWRHRLLSSYNDSPRIDPLSVRSKLVVIVDEERDFANFVALSAFRQGFRALPISTELLYELFIELEDTQRKTMGLVPELVVADLFVNFPDTISPPPAVLSKRREFMVSKSASSVVMTTGARGPEWNNARNDNLTLVKQSGWAIIHKPLPGLIGFWKVLSTGQRRGFWKGLLTDPEFPGILPYLRQQYNFSTSVGELVSPGIGGWKEKEFALSKERGCPSFDNHSAPGPLLVIAEILLDHAERTASDENYSPVQRAVVGATFARYALETLGGLTHASSLRALQIVQTLEVRSEAIFMGVEYELAFRDRFSEIKNEVNAICSRFDKDRSEVAGFHAEIKILKEVHRELESNGEREECEGTLALIRSVERHLWWKRSPFIRYPTFVLRSYFEALMSSPKYFSIVLLFWLVVAGLYFNRFQTKPGVEGTWVYGCLAFLFGESIDLQKMQPFFGPIGLIVFSLIGFAHLGIFISQIYSLVSKK